MNQNQKFPDLERSSILIDYYASGISVYAIAKKYSINKRTLSYWIKKYPIDTVLVSLPAESNEEVMARKEVNESDEIVRLQARIKALEKALAFSKLEIQARDMLIDMAEQQEKIQIRKKSGVK